MFFPDKKGWTQLVWPSSLLPRLEHRNGRWECRTLSNWVVTGQGQQWKVRSLAWVPVSIIKPTGQLPALVGDKNNPLSAQDNLHLILTCSLRGKLWLDCQGSPEKMCGWGRAEPTNTLLSPTALPPPGTRSFPGLSALLFSVTTGGRESRGKGAASGPKRNQV